MIKPRLLILDPDPASVRHYERVLASRCELLFETSLTALDRKRRGRIDLVLSEMDFEDGKLDERISVKKPSSPILVVSKISDLERMRRVSSAGVLGYLVKPFHESALILAVERSFLAVARARVAIETFEVVTDDGRRSAKLTAKEMQIFSFLRENWGRAIPREAVIERVWGAVNVGTKSLDVHLFHLRQKIAPLDLRIEHVAERGFRLFDARIEGQTEAGGGRDAGKKN